MPATCVPWPEEESVSASPSTKNGFVAGFPRVLKTSVWLKTIFTFWTVFEPKAKSECVPSIPESRLAAATPPVSRAAPEGSRQRNHGRRAPPFARAGLRRGRAAEAKAGRAIVAGGIAVGERLRVSWLRGITCLDSIDNGVKLVKSHGVH